jgi:hypothetical protein
VALAPGARRRGGSASPPPPYRPSHPRAPIPPPRPRPAPPRPKPPPLPRPWVTKVDVTTEETDASGAQINLVDRGTRAVIGGSSSDWLGSPAGGIAYVGTFGALVAAPHGGPRRPPSQVCEGFDPAAAGEAEGRGLPAARTPPHTRHTPPPRGAFQRGELLHAGVCVPGPAGQWLPQVCVGGHQPRGAARRAASAFQEARGGSR